jgi:predicted TIM-barrel enzyme
MEEQLFNVAIGAFALAGSAYIAWRYRHQVRETVASWLRTHGLEKSALMDALMVCDTVIGTIEKRVICKILVTTQKTGEQQISETTYSMEEFQKNQPDLYATLEKTGHAYKNILKQVM